jgi:hypothetical protein
MMVAYLPIVWIKANISSGKDFTASQSAVSAFFRPQRKGVGKGKSFAGAMILAFP